MTTQFWKRRNLATSMVLLLLLSLGFGTDALAQASQKAGALRVVLPPGDVARASGNQVMRTDAAKNMTLYYKDILETGLGGRLRARLDDGSILALGPQSKLTVTQYDAKSQQSAFQLEYGKVRAQVVQLTRPGSKFEVRTNTAVAGVLGTDEVVDAFSPTATMVLCVDGVVGVSNADPAIQGTVLLNPGQLTIVQQGLAPSAARTASATELQNLLEGTAGTAPEPVVDVGTGFVTAGTDYVLSAADSFATGTITDYQWSITRASDSASVYSQAQNTPTITLDTTPWQPGNYNGTLTIRTSNNQTASVNFGFVIIPAGLGDSSPEQLIQQLQLAYETLQPSEFMKLFDPVKYSGYAALEQSVETSFRNLSQARVHVRRANGQTFEQGKVAVYQVDFETQFSTKQEPGRLFVTREQATLRMESGSGWLIADVPQGNLGGAGLLGVPGVSDPSQSNNSEANVGSALHISVTGGGIVFVPAGGVGDTFTIQNTSNVPITITFILPPGLTLTVNGVAGTTFTIPPGATAQLVFSAAPGTPPGTEVVSSTVTSGDNTVPGPEIPVTIFQLSLSFPNGGGSAANPVPVLLGFGGSTSVQVSSTVSGGNSVNLSGTGGQVTSRFSPNPVALNPGNNSANSTITMQPVPGTLPGSDQVTVQAAAGSTTVSAPLFINRIVPFTISGPGSVTLTANQGGSVTFNVGFNAPFTGPVLITAPSGGAVSFSPASITLNSPGPVSFTAFRGSALPPTSFTFTATAGAFSQPVSVTIDVVQPVQCSLSAPGSISLAPGQSGQVTATVGFLGGIAQAVTVSLASTSGSGFSVTGGGSVPNASGSVNFTVSAAANAAPGSGSFTIVASDCSPAPQAQVGVVIGGSFDLTGPATVNVLRGGSIPLNIGVTAQQGFNAPVTLTASSSNPGITITGPSSVLPGQSAQFTVTATANATPPATLTITGTSGSVTRTLTINALIGSFTLSTTATQPIPLFLGSSASLPVTVTPASGFNGDVTLTATATGGVTVNSVSTVTGGSGTRTFTISAPANATPGTATVTITATSGALTSTLSVPVIIAEGFSLSSDPATFFLGNVSPLVFHVQRQPNFQGSVLIQLGALPTGITSVQPTSAVVPAGSTSTTFQITAANDPTLIGQTASIPCTGQGTSATAAQTGNQGGAQIVACTATGKFQAPFTVSVSSTDLGTVQQGQTVTATVNVTFAPGFAGPVQVTGVGAANVGVVSSPVQLTSSGTANVTFSGNSPGPATVQVTAQAGTYTVTSSFTLTVQGPPPPPPDIPVITSSLSASGTVGVAFSYQITATHSPTSFGAFGLPASLTVNTSTGAITGTPTASGTFSVTLSATNNSGTGTATLSLTINPGVNFSLTVTPTSPAQVNANVPVALQVQVVPVQNFNSPVTITVPDGVQMHFDPVCGRPPGFVSYTGSPTSAGTLTFIINPPFSSPTSFCMSAGQGSNSTVTTGTDSTTITGNATNSATVTVPYSFTIGAPQLSIAPAPQNSFTIRSGTTATGTVTLTPQNGFNLPVNVHITGVGSFISNSGPVYAALPAGITSADCGPDTAGKTVSPSNTTTTCQIANSNTSSSTLLNLELFGTFGGGAKTAVTFQICATDANGTPCNPAVQRLPNVSQLRENSQPNPTASNTLGAQLTLSAADVRVTPSLPKAGDKVVIEARIQNPGTADLQDVPVALLINKQTVATHSVTVAAGHSETVEFEWEAAYDPRLNVAVWIDPESQVLGENKPSRMAVLKNFFVESPAASSARMGRSALLVQNGQCGGFRLLTGSQTSCGGSSDFEVNPLITADGQLQVQVLSLNGGMIDLGSQPMSGILALPESGYQPRALLENGHVYAVESNGKYGLIYVTRVQSDVDPRLAKLSRSSQSVRSLEDLQADGVGDLLDRARITVDFQWAYLEDGSRRMQYGFRMGQTSGAVPYRQPRTTSPAVKQ